MSKRNIEFLDHATGFCKRAIDILFIKNPKGTSIGFIFGFIINGIINFLKPIWEKTVLNFDAFNKIVCIAIGVFVFNISFLKKFEFDKDIEQALAYIKECEKSNKYEKWQIYQMYKNLYEIVLQKTRINSSGSAVEDDVVDL